MLLKGAPDGSSGNRKKINKVLTILKEAAKCKLDVLKLGANFNELGFDSLEKIELVLFLNVFYKRSSKWKKGLVST